MVAALGCCAGSFVRVECIVISYRRQWWWVVVKTCDLLRCSSIVSSRVVLRRVSATVAEFVRVRLVASMIRVLIRMTVMVRSRVNRFCLPCSYLQVFSVVMLASNVRSIGLVRLLLVRRLFVDRVIVDLLSI